MLLLDVLALFAIPSVFAIYGRRYLVTFQVEGGSYTLLWYNMQHCMCVHYIHCVCVCVCAQSQSLTSISSAVQYFT